MQQADKQLCIERLNRRMSEIQEILAILKDNKGLSDDDVKRVQERLKFIIRRIQGDCEVANSKSGSKAMTEVEKEYYYPAMQDAIAEIKVKANSIPDQNWIAQLETAQRAIEFYRDRIKSI